ncbi:hypothetical protein N7470_002353 [Penicillium chermesinum]|nr:hypothetical protein N7470_002353 [Penicillium chermesinum]
MTSAGLSAKAAQFASLIKPIPDEGVKFSDREGHTMYPSQQEAFTGERKTGLASDVFEIMTSPCANFSAKAKRVGADA